MKRFFELLEYTKTKREAFFIGVLVSALIFLPFYLFGEYATNRLIKSYRDLVETMQEKMDACEFYYNGELVPCFIPPGVEQVKEQEQKPIKINGQYWT
jgi:hypothetical protein